MTAVMGMLLLTVFVLLCVGIGLGYNYNVVETKTKELRQSYGHSYHNNSQDKYGPPPAQPHWPRDPNHDGPYHGHDWAHKQNPERPWDWPNPPWDSPKDRPWPEERPWEIDWFRPVVGPKDRDDGQSSKSNQNNGGSNQGGDGQSSTNQDTGSPQPNTTDSNTTGGNGSTTPNQDTGSPEPNTTDSNTTGGNGSTTQNPDEPWTWPNPPLGWPPNRPWPVERHWEIDWFPPEGWPKDKLWHYPPSQTYFQKQPPNSNNNGHGPRPWDQPNPPNDWPSDRPWPVERPWEIEWFPPVNWPPEKYWNYPPSKIFGMDVTPGTSTAKNDDRAYLTEPWLRDKPPWDWPKNRPWKVERPWEIVWDPPQPGLSRYKPWNYPPAKKEYFEQKGVGLEHGKRPWDHSDPPNDWPSERPWPVKEPWKIKWPPANWTTGKWDYPPSEIFGQEQPPDPELDGFDNTEGEPWNEPNPPWDWPKDRQWPPVDDPSKIQWFPPSRYNRHRPWKYPKKKQRRKKKAKK